MPGNSETRESQVRKLSVSIDCPAAEAYEFLCAPEIFSKWASWAQGPAAVRFTERNRHGVLDHSVTLPGGAPMYVPLRVIAKGPVCDLVLTVFLRPEINEECMIRDLQAAKRLLETR